MKLFPNPANQYILLSIILKTKLKNGQEIEITVNTNQGQQVFRKILAKQQDEVLISTITCQWEHTYVQSMYLVNFRNATIYDYPLNSLTLIPCNHLWRTKRFFNMGKFFYFFFVVTLAIVLHNNGKRHLDKDIGQIGY